ncbi:unannotated protein [freshwater metagenome]|uniref:Unannotated protein n=1 Tax=freshwater metagenome TaxID=449393 RepID=A0A6J7LKY4_9ZZZZ
MVTPDELVARWTGWRSKGSRPFPWPCHAALEIGASQEPACGDHDSTVECTLAYFPHALVTARTTPVAVRARLHELSRIDGPAGWPACQHARDTHHGAPRAAEAARLPAIAVRCAMIADLSPDETALTVCGTTYAIPAGRPLGALQHRQAGRGMMDPSPSPRVRCCSPCPRRRAKLGVSSRPSWHFAGGAVRCESRGHDRVGVGGFDGRGQSSPQHLRQPASSLRGPPASATVKLLGVRPGFARGPS